MLPSSINLMQGMVNLQANCCKLDGIDSQSHGACRIAMSEFIQMINKINRNMFYTTVHNIHRHNLMERLNAVD